MNFLFINVNQEIGLQSSDTIPLSLGYILAYLKSLGYEGVILDDLQDRPLSLHVLEKWIRKVEPKVIGFTAYQCNMERIRFFSLYVKSRHNNIRILLGGPQAMFMPSAALKELEDIDIICRGEGEIVTAAIAECLEKNRPLSSVNGITFREDGEIVDTELEPDLPENLDQYPSPYLNDIMNLEGKETAIMLTSRGCEHMCLFCITPSFCNKKVRHHSAKRVLDEMEYLAEKGIRGFWFADPNFTASFKNTLEILNGKIERGIKTPFWCQTRSDLVDERMLKKLRETGADTIALGLESGSPGVLKSTGKGIELNHLRRMIEVSQSLGIEIELFSIFGLPGETVEQAGKTLAFVQSYKVPIQLNSHAQQMQLYFGSIYEKNPEKFGFKALPSYRPSYLSIGEQYKTKSLTKKDIRKIRHIWALAKEEVAQNVRYKERSFDILDFLLGNKEDLMGEETFYEYGAIVSCVLEEQEHLWRFINGYVNRLNPGEHRLNQLISKLNIFKETDQGASATSRINFDCRTEMDGAPFQGMKDGYRDAVLGQDRFMASFEKAFIGVRKGEEITFQFTFPNDYFEAELQGITIEVWAKVYKVLNPVKVKSLGELKLLNIRNHYPSLDLDRLHQENDVLYYMALKDIHEQELVKMPLNFLMLAYYYAKLHRNEDIRRMAKLLANDKKALNALGDILCSAGRYLDAAVYYGKADSNEPGILIKKAHALFLGGEVHKALKILNSMPEESNLPFQELLLECLKVVQPHSKKISQLDRNVVDLKVKTAFEHEITDQSNSSTDEPIVHGA